MTTDLVPGAWRERPSLIEWVFPAQKISVEAQTERKANAGQTLTVLGSYWKGRKPLVLVRACILGALLPKTERPDRDLEVFELLMAIDDGAFAHRLKDVSRDDVRRWGGELAAELIDPVVDAWRVKGPTRRALLGQVLQRMPYAERLSRRSLRPEELPTSAYDDIWGRVNAHLGTTARSHAELVEQLGVLRFGHRPRVADTFCGGGSIPFEAARVGCDVAASDLNPIACMLTWGALNVLGVDDETRESISAALTAVADAVEAEIDALGIERDEDGYRAKAYLYCLETRCPQTGWMVPMAPSWVISEDKKCCAKLIADEVNKRFKIEVKSGASSREMDAARTGTVVGGDLVYRVGAKEYRTPIKTIRGDRRVEGQAMNALRRWQKGAFVPQEDDVFLERLYCVQWVKKPEDEGREPKTHGRRERAVTFFRGVGDDDLVRERRVVEIVRANLPRWQSDGIAPDLAIEPGENTDQPIRERGWGYWHQLFPPRQILVLSVLKKAIAAMSTHAPAATVFFARTLDFASRLSAWENTHAKDLPGKAFSNQSLNTWFNFGVRASPFLLRSFIADLDGAALPDVERRVTPHAVTGLHGQHDLFITDPPYADAVNYHEITEYFIAWLRKNPPEPFREWVWDSRRALAIKGTGDDFRREMTAAYGAMAEHTSEGGLQIVMFTHQDGAVWADMAGIFWGAGLQVTAAWYIATETTSEMKKGGYVQGTVILVLRKRRERESGWKDEIVQEIREEVKRQIETMVGLNQSTYSGGRVENLFEDVDLQMAGFAAALRVLTRYTHIDGRDMAAEALRPKAPGAASLTDELIAYAVAVANEELVPDGISRAAWEALGGVERFYLRMLDVESSGASKLDSYQNFAKAFRVDDFKPLLASARANDARLKTAAEFRLAEFGDDAFGRSPLRAILFALHELQEDADGDDVLHHLRENVGDYFQRRTLLREVARYVAAKRIGRAPDEASAATVLDQLIANERLGG